MLLVPKMKGERAQLGRPRGLKPAVAQGGQVAGCRVERFAPVGHVGGLGVHLELEIGIALVGRVFRVLGKLQAGLEIVFHIARRAVVFDRAPVRPVLGEGELLALFDDGRHVAHGVPVVVQFFAQQHRACGNSHI